MKGDGMSDISWTMNCILFGAEIIKLVKDGKDEQALDRIMGLSSTLDEETARYLLIRLKDI